MKEEDVQGPIFMKGRILGNWPPDRVVCLACGKRSSRKAVVDSSGDRGVRLDYGSCFCGGPMCNATEYADAVRKYRAAEKLHPSPSARP